MQASAGAASENWLEDLAELDADDFPDILEQAQTQVRASWKATCWTPLSYAYVSAVA